LGYYRLFCGTPIGPKALESLDPIVYTKMGSAQGFDNPCIKKGEAFYKAT
jgi:hypothetical protein